MATVEKLTSIYSSHSVYLERVAAKFGNDVLPYLESIERRVSGILDKMPSKMLSPQELSAIRIEISKITSEELQAYTTQYKLDNKELGAHEVAFNARTLESVTAGYEAVIPSAGIVNSVAIKTPIKVGDNQYTTYNRYVASYWKQYAKVIDDSVAAGFIQGGTNREIAARILDTIGLDKEDGDLAKARRAAKTMARTGSNHYATQATVAFVDKNDEVLIGYRFLSTLDNRTSKQCSALDQRVFKKAGSMPMPPLHPNCRSRLIYEIDGRYKYDDSGSTRPENFTDADGDRDPKRVSSKKTYFESVKSMSEEDRIEVLGPQLGKALAKMDPDEFAKSLIDSTYEPLTIAELKAKDNKLGRILKGQSPKKASKKSTKPIKDRTSATVKDIGKSSSIGERNIKEVKLAVGKVKPLKAKKPSSRLSNELSGDEEAYLGYYKGDGFYKSNDILRNKSKYSSSELESAELMRDSIDGAINKSSLNDDAFLYRGIKDKDIFANLSNNSIGAEIPIRTAQSTASNPQVALTYSGAMKAGDNFVSAGNEAVIMKINAKAGSKVLDMERLSGIGNTSESEFLLSSKGKYVVTNVREEFAPDGKLALKIVEVDYVD